jgi:hypothetical protein
LTSMRIIDLLARDRGTGRIPEYSPVVGLSIPGGPVRAHGSRPDTLVLSAQPIGT